MRFPLFYLFLHLSSVCYLHVPCFFFPFFSFFFCYGSRFDFFFVLIFRSCVICVVPRSFFCVCLSFFVVCILHFIIIFDVIPFFNYLSFLCLSCVFSIYLLYQFYFCFILCLTFFSLFFIFPSHFPCRVFFSFLVHIFSLYSSDFPFVLHFRIYFSGFFFYIEFVLYLPFTFFVFLRSGGLNLSSHNTCTITHLPIHKHHLCHQPKETPTFLKISIFIICFGIFLPINYIILVTSSVAHFPTNKFLLFTSRVFFFFIFFIFLVFQLNYLLLFLFLFTVSHSLHPISSFV